MTRSGRTNRSGRRANRSGNDAVPVWVRRSNEEAVSQPHRITWPVELSCHHTGYYITPIPAVGDQVFCRSCADYSTVVGHPPQWRLRCRDCTLSRTAESEDECYRAGSRHTMKRQSHTVDIMLGDEKKGSVGAAGDALLPYEKETGDRLESAARNQRALRDLIQRQHDTGG